jgi:putative hydrolase of the HAD superfamily
VTDRRGDDTDVAWLMATDRDGFAPRADAAAAIRDRCNLADETAGTVGELLIGTVADVRPDAAVAQALRRAAGAGWAPVIVTNGTVRQQQAVDGIVARSGKGSRTRND